MFVFEVKFRFGRETPTPEGEHAPDLPAGDVITDLAEPARPSLGFSVPAHMTEDDDFTDRSR